MLSTGWDWFPESIVLLWVILHGHLFQKRLPAQAVKSTFAVKGDVLGMRWDLFPMFLSELATKEKRRYDPIGQEELLETPSHESE